MTIKLGILVVYLVSEDREKLLGIHLDRIARHTGVPYTIHASATRLPPACRRRLEANPNVTLHGFPATNLRGSREHSYYLDQLARAAVDDGATHVATLHVDSFPIRDGWAEALAEKLSAPCVFATTERISTACLLFHRSFYLQHRPTFLPSGQEEAAPEFREYVHACAPNLHSGIGYGFTAWQHGLTWYEMTRSSRSTAANGAAIYDDALFHLKGAARLTAPRPVAVPAPIRALGRARFESVLAFSRALVPEAVRLRLRARLKRPLDSLIDAPRIAWETDAMIADSERLLADPDSYIDRLRHRA